MDWAVYDLSRNSPSFDFLTFMQGALQAKAGGIWFVPGYQSGPYGGEEGQRRRVKTIVFPACDLYKIPHRMESNPPKSVFGGHMMNILKTIIKPFPLIPTQQALDKINDRFKGKRPIVVTLRNCSYEPLRNSSPDWRQWAKDHEAEVIEDWYDSPVSLDERVAMCELASLNMGVSCGANVVYHYSYRPYITLKMINEEYKASRREYFQRYGWNLGDQMPWATSKQRIIWNTSDSYDIIENEYQAYIKANG